MFLRLFLKECKLTLKCTTYYIIIVCMLVFYNTQFGSFQMISKPKPNQESYGMTYSDDERVIMDSTLHVMIMEYNSNRYVTYPIGFYKEVTINEKKQEKILEIILKLTRLDKDEFISALNTYLTDPNVTFEQLNLKVAEDISYEEFMNYMKEADKMLGGGSNYSESYVKNNTRVPVTYEEALQEYNEIIEKDHLSGAYARLFCDYMGIILSILPVFLAVTRALRDKRAGANQVIYSKRVSSITVIMSRYLSIVVMIMLPVLLIAGYVTAECLYFGAGEGIKVDVFAFFKYSFLWLLPAVMISSSLGLFLTELTQTAIAILIMGAWWLVSLFMGVVDLKGGAYGWNLIPRHNIIGNYQAFIDNFKVLALNRLTYAFIAILLAAAAVFVYDLKRRGKLAIYGKRTPNSKNKS